MTRPTEVIPQPPSFGGVRRRTAGDGQLATIAVDASRAARPRRTGTERYALELLRALLQIPSSQRWRLYFDPGAAADVVEPSPNWQARTVGPPRLWSQVGLAMALLREPADLLFVPAHVLPFAYRGRSVVTVHDLGYRWFPAAYTPAALLYLHLTTAWAAARATRLLVPSAAVALDLQRLHPIARGRVRVVHEGVSSSFRPRPPGEVAELRARLGLREPYLLALGTVQPRKNLLAALRAFDLLPDALKGRLRLVVAGQPGRGQAELEAEAARLGLEDRVRTLGYVPEADLPALYTGAEALVFPSLHEGFGLPALEAMACGTPVVAARAAALTEVVGEAGLLFDPLDPARLAACLQELLETPALRARLAEAGPHRAATFTWERCAEETLAVLEEALT